MTSNDSVKVVRYSPGDPWVVSLDSDRSVWAAKARIVDRYDANTFAGAKRLYEILASHLNGNCSAGKPEPVRQSHPPAHPSAADGLLTDAEHRAMDLTVELRNVIRNEIIAEGAGARQDRAELAADIHRIQHRILRQAAARAYPDRYRLLGAALGPPAERE